MSKRRRHWIDGLLFMEPHLCLFRRDAPSLYRIDLRTLRVLAEIEYPLGWQRIKLLGSCNGLLCISKPDDRNVAIWNPTTGGHKFLPPADTQIRSGLCSSTCVHGFGYDHDENGYVLLRLVQTFEEPIESVVSIYRSRDNAWRRLEGMPYSLVNMHKMGVFVGGRLHWIMRHEEAQDSAQVLVAFDIRTEGFVEVDLPNLIDKTLGMDLAVQGGCLCLIIYGKRKGVDVWIMREYGLERPWHPLFTIPDHPRERGLVRPLDYSQNNGQVLVAVGDKNLVWYDLQTRRNQRFHISGMPNSFEAEICLQTHVWLD